MKIIKPISIALVHAALIAGGSLITIDTVQASHASLESETLTPEELQTRVRCRQANDAFFTAFKANDLNQARQILTTNTDITELSGPTELVFVPSQRAKLVELLQARDNTSLSKLQGLHICVPEDDAYADETWDLMKSLFPTLRFSCCLIPDKKPKVTTPVFKDEPLAAAASSSTPVVVTPPEKIESKSYQMGVQGTLPFALIEGFANPEGSHVWTNDTHATVRVPLVQDGKCINQITFKFSAFGSSDHQQRVKISGVGIDTVEQTYTDRNLQQVVIKLPHGLKDEFVDIQLALPDAREPGADDPRKVALAFISADVTYSDAAKPAGS
jgi:hypothetical protein